MRRFCKALSKGGSHHLLVTSAKRIEQQMTRVLFQSMTGPRALGSLKDCRTGAKDRIYARKRAGTIDYLPGFVVKPGCVRREARRFLIRERHFDDDCWTVETECVDGSTVEIFCWRDDDAFVCRAALKG